MSDRFGFFCRTYHKDAERLVYLLKSIEKFCDGFAGITVVSPKSSEDAIRPVVERFPFASYSVCEANAPRDFIGQQLTKMTAHHYAQYDYIIHIDSDCAIIRPVTPAEIMKDGKPVMLMGPYATFYERGFNVPWQSVTSRFARRQVNYEFMRRFPLTFPFAFYPAMNEWFEKNHGVKVEDAWRLIHGDLFSEFNIMGAFSYYSEEQYHTFIDSSVTPPPPPFVKQFCLIASRDDRTIGAEDAEFLAALLD